MLSRRDAIYPATVVGKPPQEDYYIGCALQEMTLPVLRLMKPGISDLWAYPETGFHPLAVLSVHERYPREAFKHALSVLGEGQLSLTKVLMVVDSGVDVRKFEDVSRALWEGLDPSDGIHLLAPTAQDTLDFTGPAMNTGSRLVLVSTRRDGDRLREDAPPAPPAPSEVHDDLEGLVPLGPAFLIARIRDGGDPAQVREALGIHPATSPYLFHVMVSPDVPLDDPMLVLWGWFTRFDPLADLHPARRETAGNRMILHFPIAIDATWKEGYRRTVALDPEMERRVASRWSEYGIPVSGAES
jgi:3-polyprenyl-4-hydroxybenzoate decarboxylase